MMKNNNNAGRKPDLNCKPQYKKHGEKIYSYECHLRKYRIKLGLTLEEFAKQTMGDGQINASGITLIERNQRLLSFYKAKIFIDFFNKRGFDLTYEDLVTVTRKYK